MTGQTDTGELCYEMEGPTSLKALFRGFLPHDEMHPTVSDQTRRPLALRQTTEQDIAFVVAAESAPECQGLVGQWPPSEHLRCLGDPTRAHLIAEQDGHRVGFAILYDLTEAGCGTYLKRIVVTTKGQGLGRHMLALLADHARTRCRSPYLWLGVLPHNARAIRCYRAGGFAPLELSPPEDERHRRLADGHRLDACLLYGLDLQAPVAR